MIQQGSAKYNDAAFKFTRLPVELKGSAAELAKAESADCFEVVPFCTSGTTGVEKAVSHIKGIVGEKVTVCDGKRLGADGTEEEVRRWTELLGVSSPRD